MNSDRFRLVYSQCLGMFVPVSETTKAQGRKSSGKRMRSSYALAAAVFSIAYTYNAIAAPPFAALPTAGVVAAGAATINTPVNTSAMTVNQTTQNAIINWGTFNIGSQASVNFAQPNSTSAVLNRVSATGGLSQIYGKLAATGQVYLINPNGILFGSGSQVNVNSLVASSLNISDDLFNKGYLSITDGTPAFSGTTGYIQVDAGAEINAATGGKVLMFAPDIKNNGLIKTPDGQTLLAAGQKVYLSASNDINLRGLLVEVDNGGTVNNGFTELDESNKPTTDKAKVNVGQIIAERGNVTLAGIAVNQNGRIKATTSVTANGSIRLQARDSIDINTLPNLKATNGGEVVLGANSLTEVTPELSNKTTVLDTVDVKKSVVDISGKAIHFDKNAWVVAAGGNVTVSAGVNPSTPALLGVDSTAPSNNSRVYFESGSGIDVSGVGSGSTAPNRTGETAEQLSVANNVVVAELRGTELADSPLQRTGILYKSKVYVDSQLTGLNGDVGTSVANVGGYVAQIGHNLGERLAAGGNVKIQSEGDIVMAPNVTINVSGGKVDYISGTVNKTRLLASNGQAYDIANASKDLTYVGIQNVSVQQQGYIQGKDAGGVTFSAPAMVLEGKLKGDTIAGARQRTLANLPKGATLEVGQKFLNGLALSQTNVLHSDIVFDGLAHNSAVPSYLDALSTDQKQTLHLGTNFTPSSFSNLRYYADGQITVKKDVNLETKVGGNLVLNGGGVDVQANLTSRSGTIEVAAKQKNAYIGLGLDKNYKNNTTQNVEIGTNSVLDVSGLWVNDKQNTAATDVIASNGGKVNISAAAENRVGGDIILKKGSSINASGGAWLNASGKLSSGKGGDISLKAGAGYADEEAHAGMLVLDGTLRADSLSAGGSLQLSSGSVTIGTKASPTANGELLLNPEFFRTGGFNSYTINSYEGLTLQEKTSLAPVAFTRILDSGYATQDTSVDITTFSHLSLLPATNAVITRKATNLSLNATTETSGNLTLEQGSKIQADPGAKLNFFARSQLTALGSVSAPAGTISMAVGREPQESDVVKYLDNQTLWLGSSSVLDVSGVADSYVNANGLRVGTVKDAGNIVLDAKQGVVVAESGAKLNLTGMHSLLDVKSGNNSYIAKDVASRGGNLSISAREGVLMDASIDAHGGSNMVATGSYDLNLYESGNTIVGVTTYPTGSREIVLKKSGKVVPTGLVKGGAIDGALNGKAYVVADNINQAGFDSVNLVSPNNIRMAENATLTTRGAIKLDAPNIVADKDSRLSLNASFVAIGNNGQQPSQSSTLVGTPEIGTGILSVTADNIELFGNQNLSGVSTANFNSKSDIQLKGVLSSSNKNDLTPKGNLNTAGNLNFTAGRIFPSTLSNYALSSTGEKATIAFNKTPGAETGVPFSVLGTLNVEAANIAQNGVLRAPFGVINLKASDKLTLEDGSITSVSAEGKTLPFGTTTNGASWDFNLGDRSANFTSLPDKAVNLDGKVVEAKVGSKVDVSGGGDLTAYEFTAGTGGSDDVLAADGVFAVLPNLKAGYMAGNSESYSNGALKAGDSIYLSGGNGLAAGNYVLLPAHYALLPGGYSVKAVAGTQDFAAQQNVVNRDGSMLVSGYRTQFGGIAADARSSGFLVASGAIARTQSEFSNTSADKFFSKTNSTQPSGSRLPADAGRVAINAVTNLILDGALITKHASTARGGDVAISSDKIAISGDGSQETGYLTLSSDKLNAIGAESLIIGAKTSSIANGTQLDVTASNVKLIGGASLTGQDITLAATDTVSMANGTSVKAAGAATQDKSALIIGNTDTAGSGDGALLRVSTGAQRDLVRNNVSDTQTNGTLDIKTGAKVSATGAIIADATKANTVNGDIALAKDGAIRLGAPKISFGTTTAPDAGLQLDNSKLAALGSPSNIQLKSYKTIDFYGTTTVGDANLKSLTLESTGLAGFGDANSAVTLTADTVKFANPDGKAFAPTGTLGNGILNVNAGKEIRLGGGTFGSAGFKTVNLNAGQVVGQAKGTLDVKADLNIDAGRITAAGLSDQTIKASGDLVTKQHEVADLAPAPLGGKLTLAAESIIHGGKIDLPSGVITLKATGSKGGNSILLQKDSQINARGSAQLLGTVAALADAGTINLQTANGNIKIEKGAIIDVSSTGGAAAGSVVISTPGTADIAGTLNGLAAVGNGVGLPKQGSFEIAAKNLASFATLNTELERGNFNQSRNIHVAQGDLSVDAGKTVTAHNVTLTTDDGNINIAGKIDASGQKGGIVKLNAGQQANDGKGNIKLASTAKIDASANFAATESAGSKGDGGKVILNTTTDSDTSPTNGSSITAAVGSEIDVSGKGFGSDGKVTLRAPRLGIGNATDADNDIAITEFKSTVKGDSASIVAEGVKVYQPAGGVINQAFVSTMKADNANFLANSDAIKSKLGLGSDTRFILASGDEVRSAGNITVTNDVNLQDGGPGTLTLRAKGDINVNSSISAGFTTAKTTGALTTGGAWTYQIAAGADLNSADVLATNNAGTGNFTLAAGKLIRTGTGDIEISTAGNFNLASIDSAIYTAGEKDTKDYSALGTFVNPPKVGNATPTFAINGGDITLASKGNMTGVSASLDSFGSTIYQLPADWLNRSGQAFNKAGNLSRSTSWWASYGSFKENIGALAGGDVNIASGGDITNLSAVVATNGRVFRASPTSSTLAVNGGGDLTVKAVGNISGGLYMVDKGLGNISGGSLTANANDINTAFAIGDASINVATRGQLDLLTVFNPLSTSLSEANFNSLGNKEVYFTTYAADSAVKLTSLSSGVTITNNTSSLTNDLKDSISTGEELLKLFPGTLNAAALGGDVSISGKLAMLPSALGDLQLAATGSIKFENRARLVMSDVAPASLPGALSPSFNSSPLVSLLTVNEGAISHSANLLHANDIQPVVLYAGKDITGTAAGEVVNLTLPKKATIFAKNDIRDFSIQGQNLKASDVTSISAGNDLLFTTSIANNTALGNNSRIDWGGPGYLDIAAGRDVNLNNAFGITTSGNLRNPYLPELGASINVLAGAANADDAKFIAKYLDPAKSKLYTSNLAAFVYHVNGISDEEIVKDDAIINNPNATAEAKSKALEAKSLRDKQTWQQFQAMDAPLQRQFVQASFFNELKQAGIEHNNPKSSGFGNYKRGYDAIATYFPNNNYQGNIDLAFSQIKTLRGGDLNLMVPGGSAVIGLPKIPPLVVRAKDDGSTTYDDLPSLLGLVTVNGGNINVFAKNNIDVAQSREFTLAGGDILNWSTLGDIDAGKGSKTATSAPPPLVRTDDKGNTVLDLAGVVSGSGIGTLQTVPNAPAGDTYLIAPNGTVNAGDAGIRSSGNLLIAATRVLGADNIQVGGTSSGVPAVTTVNISFNASASADSAASNKQGEQLGAADKLGENSKMASLLSLINVEVISLGDESTPTTKSCTDEKSKDGKNKKDCQP